MRQFFTDTVQICCGICELLCIAIDKMYPTDQWLISTIHSFKGEGIAFPLHYRRTS